MPGPSLSASEQNAISSVLTTIRVSQALRDHPAQAQATGDLAQFDVTLELIAAAEALGFSGKVDEYDGPSGYGWSATIRLVRDGVTWEMCHHEGPETHRAHGWREVA
jgi:hypothetical protein